MSKGLVPRGTHEENPLRKVAGDLSAWQKGINSLGKNDKRESSQNVGLKKWNLKVLEKERPIGPPRTGKLVRGF